jgi:hypothetical protein
MRGTMGRRTVTVVMEECCHVGAPRGGGPPPLQAPGHRGSACGQRADICPRARSPQGDERPRLSPADGTQDAGEDARAPRGKPCQSHAWRGARPRARSPQGDGRPGLSPADGTQDAGEDARAPRGHPANPTVGDALVLERGARRATGDQAYRQPPREASQDAGGDARAPRGHPANPTVGDALVRERGARRATGVHAYRQPPREASQDAGGDARAPRGGNGAGIEIGECWALAVKPVCERGKARDAPDQASPGSLPAAAISFS